MRVSLSHNSTDDDGSVVRRERKPSGKESNLQLWQSLIGKNKVTVCCAVGDGRGKGKELNYLIFQVHGIITVGRIISRGVLILSWKYLVSRSRSFLSKVSIMTKKRIFIWGLQTFNYIFVL